MLCRFSGSQVLVPAGSRFLRLQKRLLHHSKMLRDTLRSRPTKWNNWNNPLLKAWSLKENRFCAQKELQVAAACEQLVLFDDVRSSIPDSTIERLVYQLFLTLRKNRRAQIIEYRFYRWCRLLRGAPKLLCWLIRERKLCRSSITFMKYNQLTYLSLSSVFFAALRQQYHLRSFASSLVWCLTVLTVKRNYLTSIICFTSSSPLHSAPAFSGGAMRFPGPCYPKTRLWDLEKSAWSICCHMTQDGKLQNL